MDNIVLTKIEDSDGSSVRHLGLLRHEPVLARPASPLGIGIVAEVNVAVVLALLGLFRQRRWI